MLHDIPEKVPLVISRSVNKTLTGIKTDAAKEITQIMNVTQAIVKDTMKINKATPTNLSAWFRSTGKPTPLTKFIGTAQTATGVSVKVRKDEPRTVIQRTFVAKMKSGHTGVFWRDWHGTRQPVNKKIRYSALPKFMRLPIEQKYGPRIPDYLGDKGPIMQRVLVKAGERMHKNIEHELDYELSKL
jgi:hypothetical protein